MSQNPDLRPSNFILNMVRGALIGTVETVPGVSGGTVALVVGVYERLIGAAGSAVTGAKELVAGAGKDNSKGRSEAFARWRRLPWGLLLAIVVGMFLALAVMSHVMSALVESQPVLTSATFFGMVLASLYVPYSLAGAWKPKDYFWALLSALAVYCIVSLPVAATAVKDPHPLMIIVAAAIAVSALLLPGLSGSFLLLTFGLYEVTLGAVKNADLDYLGFFALGAVIGLATVVKGLEWLLEHWRHMTLVVLTGVMVGALRALWPWTTDDNRLLPVGEQGGLALVMCAVGFATVAGVMMAEKVLSRRKSSGGKTETQ